MAHENTSGAGLNVEQILATLASLQSTPNAAEPNVQQLSDPTQLPPQSYTPPTIQDRPSDPRLSGRAVPPQRPRPPKPLDESRINASTIVEWKHGLRCVNKIAAQNPNFAIAIQKMIRAQERSVKDWEAGRERLLQEQATKRENEQTYRAAVSLPGLLDGTGPLRTPEREQEELDRWNEKVYRACRQLVDAQSAELKMLDIPFFCTRPDLVTLEEAEPCGSSETGAACPSASGKISKKQLLDLQRKMLEYLIEMYGD